MRRRLLLTLAVGILAALIGAAPAGAVFGLHDFDVTFTGPEGAEVTQAGSHPFAMKTSFKVDTEEVGAGTLPGEAIKDLEVAQILGFAGDQTAVPRCATADFLQLRENRSEVPECADSSAIGLARATVGTENGSGTFTAPLYLLEPPPGKVAKLGFIVQRVALTVDVSLDETFSADGSSPYKIVAHTRNISQALEVFGAEITLWGVPADPAHDSERGACVNRSISCSAGVVPRPFLTLPRACSGPLATEYELDSWLHPGDWLEGSVLTHDSATPPNPLGMTGCGKLGFAPTTEAQPSSASAESSSGLDFRINVNDEGLKNREGIAQADTEAVRVALPAGMTANPSAAEGLGVCTIAQYEAEELATAPGGGCPEAANLGSLEAESPLLENHPVHGILYLAQQDDPATPEPEAENPFDSLLALYMVFRDPELGIFIKLPVEVEPSDEHGPNAGRIVTTVEDVPQLPLSHVDVHLRSGPRAPLVTPPACGAYTTTVQLAPSSGAPPLTETPSFHITSGVNGGACPTAGVLPFKPGFSAGSTNNAAGTYSPFNMRLTRGDGEQDMTRFSAVLPPGVTGKIAGIARCPDAQIAAAKAKSGRGELAAPSCPAASRVGHVLAGAGVGTALTYVSGNIYLAGPFGGDPLSVVAIVPAVAGPFDVGTVVTRVALALNPNTYEAEVDGAHSDPFPHLLKGLPLKIRDLQVFTDRPNFTLNATSCAPELARGTLFGSYADPFSPADDVPVPLSTRYQAASCASLAFKPKLSLKLKGGTRRGDHPALTATVNYPPGGGYANTGRAVVVLPRSEFIDNAHIQNPCTRVQFNAHQCPSGSVLGTAVAHTPLLDNPLEGPVYFRSNGGERLLPDVVADLGGEFHIVLVGHVDSVHGRIRTTFESLPDAPAAKVTFSLRGGKKGLLINNRNLCAHKLKAIANLKGQNGRAYNSEPVVKASGCAKHRQRPKH